ncbi:metallothionein-like protein 1 [Coffea arabica]|uniref:Metallothionein-like protein 1 n=2 Tax=Coffea arabica TaxID=13443 RepID=MT1_COFAR|nr:RecName: Full=Metallothionein-like protein 1; Short=MT-1 [Coffea arabica]AAA19611.1 metallothionein I [Coffea arabica]prf//2106417A metallothionein I [Coffea arabica]
MSCCGGNCGCGAGCKCSGGCGGCKMYPELSYTENTAAETLILGVAPPKTTYLEGAGEEAAAENGGCKCGPDCKCNPCNCK